MSIWTLYSYKPVIPVVTFLTPLAINFIHIKIPKDRKITLSCFVFILKIKIKIAFALILYKSFLSILSYSLNTFVVILKMCRPSQTPKLTMSITNVILLDFKYFEIKWFVFSDQKRPRKKSTSNFSFSIHNQTAKMFSISLIFQEKSIKISINIKMNETFAILTTIFISKICKSTISNFWKW